jgi:hypothetical protein
MVQGCSFSAALGSVDDLNVRIILQSLVGLVGRTVGNPDDVEPLLGVVELADVLHLQVYYILFVIGTYHESHGGQSVVIWHVGLLRLALEEPLDEHQQIEQYTIANVGVEANEEACPKEYLQCCHGYRVIDYCAKINRNLRISK